MRTTSFRCFPLRSWIIAPSSCQTAPTLSAQNPSVSKTSGRSCQALWRWSKMPTRPASNPIAFPIKYLGLPLTHRKLRRVDYQTLVNKVAGRLAGWQGRFLSIAGWTTLVKSVLTSIPIYFLTTFKTPKAVLQALDHIRRRFLWVDHEPLSGGKCKINWEKKFANQLSLVGSASSTSNNSLQPLDFVGSGKNGKTHPNLELAWKSPAAMRIEAFSPRQPRSPSRME